jgi:hypothetical protein
MFGFQTWSPFKEIIILSLPNGNKKYLSQKNGETWSLRVLKSVILGNLKIVAKSRRSQDSGTLFRSKKFHF